MSYLNYLVTSNQQEGVTVQNETFFVYFDNLAPASTNLREFLL